MFFESLVLVATCVQWTVDLSDYFRANAAEIKKSVALFIERKLYGGPSTEQALMLNRYKIPVNHSRVIAIRPT